MTWHYQLVELNRSYRDIKTHSSCEAWDSTKPGQFHSNLIVAGKITSARQLNRSQNDNNYARCCRCQASNAGVHCRRCALHRSRLVRQIAFVKWRDVLCVIRRLLWPTQCQYVMPTSVFRQRGFGFAQMRRRHQQNYIVHCKYVSRFTGALPVLALMPTRVSANCFARVQYGLDLKVVNLGLTSRKSRWIHWIFLFLSHVKAHQL